MVAKKSQKKDLPKHACTGFNWKSKSRDTNKASRTRGKEKTKQCQATFMEKHFAKYSKSYKHKDYKIWFENAKRINK